ncbi:MAG: serine/threonine protein kinase [Fimbriimonadaceae bacterium]|nr:serine/threonine protein kinase [Fimbriimonadaceae bacterium]QYK57944.1 MAG: serine/threonine protein kinase [Fimbriimonadaceae bacterium]
MSQSPPQTIGKYQIIREIARSNDIVYEAYDPVMNRRVAVKELNVPGGSTSQQREDRVKRFLREARAAGSLVHPNIVTIYEVGEEAGRRFIAMEFLDGQNLRNLLDTQGLVEPKKAVEIAIGILEGLSFAHSKGVIHRDIKPDNIQLLESGQVKITDFGIARLTFEPNLTIDGQVFGTPSYMSPEQVNGREIDARSDLFGVGVILYEMVSGQKPFQGDSVVAITYAIMNHEPTPPQRASHSLWQAIQRAIDKSPQLRWSSAEQMAQALKGVVAEMESGSVVSTPVAPNPTLIAPPPVGPVNPGPPPVQVAGLGTAPPQSSTYNPPYGQPHGQSYGQPYGQPGSNPIGAPYTGQMGTPQVPVYYPPRPRRTMSPHTRQFLGRLVWAFVLMGSLAAIVTVGIQSLSGALQDQPMPRIGAPTTKGKDKPGETVRRASADDADAAVEDAETTADPAARRTAWSRAARIWSEVVAASENTDVANKAAVASFLESANRSYEAGNFTVAREATYQAMGFASGDAAQAKLVRDWEDALRGR